MIPMRVYFDSTFYNEFIYWYKTHPKLKNIEEISTENASKIITISEGISPSNNITPQVVIKAKKSSIIKLVDKFLFEEKKIIAFKEPYELRINLR